MEINKEYTLLFNAISDAIKELTEAINNGEMYINENE